MHHQIMPAFRPLQLLRIAVLLSAVTLPLAAEDNPATTVVAATGGRPPDADVKFSLDTALIGQTDLHARNAPAGGISVRRFGAKLSVPLPPLGRSFTRVGLDYSEHRLDCDAGTPLPDRLKSLSFGFTVIHPLDEHWSLVGSVSPGWHEAGGGFSGHSFGVGVLGIAVRKFSPSLSAGFGFVYNSLSRGTGRAIPIATLDWKPAPDWRVVLGFPRTGVIYTVAKNLTVDFTAEADFGSFYVNADPLPRAPGNRPPLDRTRLEYQALRVGPGVNWAATPSLSVRLAAGAVPLIKADYHQRNYIARAEQAAPFVGVSLEQKF